jgi:hypothetical protein
VEGPIHAYIQARGLNQAAGEDRFEGECPFCAANPHFLMGGSGDWECRSCGRSGEFADLPSPEPAKPTSGGTGPSSTSPPGLIKDRPPYGRRPIESPRQCVFAGTVNHATYLRDETGNRRFWPVTCGRIDIEALRRDRDQLWAEAVARFHAGDPWWLDSPELNALAAEEQSERLQQDDPWSEKVIEWAGDWCEMAGDVSVYGVLETGLDLSVQQRDQRAANRVARILKAAGFERFRKRDGEKLEWRYRRRPGGTA